MDVQTARETMRLLATLIGEIMEDHVDMALSPPNTVVWPGELQRAGEDIAGLAAAVAIIVRRGGRDEDRG